jgi:hypothetical protein
MIYEAPNAVGNNRISIATQTEPSDAPELKLSQTTPTGHRTASTPSDLSSLEDAKKIQLHSIVPFECGLMPWLTLATASVTAIFSIYYISNSSKESFRLLWTSSFNTLWTINVLSHVTFAALAVLVSVAFDSLRWKLCSQTRSLRMMDFLALSGNTGPFGLLKLLFAAIFRSRKGNSQKRYYRIKSFRLWAAFRFDHLTSASNFW